MGAALGAAELAGTSLTWLVDAELKEPTFRVDGALVGVQPVDEVVVVAGVDGACVAALVTGRLATLKTSTDTATAMARR